jgi:hypothetical protein
MHSRHHNHPDGPRPGRLARILRAIVFVALLPAILVAGVILLPVFAIGRLFGLGRGHACGRHRGDPGDAASAA